MAGHRPFAEIRAGLAERIGEQRLAEEEAVALEDYERFEQEGDDGERSEVAEPW